MADLDLAPPPAVWVLDTGASLDRADRAAERLAKQGATVSPLGSRWCIELPSTVDHAKLRRRTERWLGGPVEERANCDVAWFPLGRGYAAVLVEPPANGLEDWLDGAGLTYREVRRPSDAEQVLRVCVPLSGLASSVAFAQDLGEAGYGVRSMYEVGGCFR